MAKKNVSQQGITSAELATAVGKSKQILINRDDGFRPVIMDGVTQGGHPVAMKAEVDALKGDTVHLSEQSLNATQQGQARTNLGLGSAAVKDEGFFVSESELTQALSDLIVEFGGTVPSD